MEKRPGKKYIPARGDLVWLEFNPQKGHEQFGLRPAITISPLEYNEKVGLALFCPITAKIKGYPFEVEIEINRKKSVILADQIKSLDWQSRKVKFIKAATKTVVDDAIKKIKLLVD